MTTTSTLAGIGVLVISYTLIVLQQASSITRNYADYHASKTVGIAMLVCSCLYGGLFLYGLVGGLLNGTTSLSLFSPICLFSDLAFAVLTGMLSYKIMTNSLSIQDRWLSELVTYAAIFIGAQWLILLIGNSNVLLAGHCPVFIGLEQLIQHIMYGMHTVSGQLSGMSDGLLTMMEGPALGVAAATIAATPKSSIPLYEDNPYVVDAPGVMEDMALDPIITPDDTTNYSAEEEEEAGTDEDVNDALQAAMLQSDPSLHDDIGSPEMDYMSTMDQSMRPPASPSMLGTIEDANDEDTPPGLAEVLRD
jgi:hypothetical protein